MFQVLLLGVCMFMCGFVCLWSSHLFTIKLKYADSHFTHFHFANDDFCVQLNL